MGRHSPFVIELTDEQREHLESTARAYTAPFHEVFRAKIILLAAEGVQNTEIARRCDTSPQVVLRWRKRFHERGLDGLADQPRPGRPPSFFAPRPSAS